MSKCFIKLGIINKKIILAFFLAASEIGYVIFNKYYPVKEVNIVLHTYSMALGEMSIKLLPYILQIRNKNKKNNLKIKQQVFTKKKCIHYTILCSLNLSTMIIEIGAALYDGYIRDTSTPMSGSNLFSSNDLILLSLEMIFIIFISIWLLKYKYYHHHIISTIVFVIFGIISELCLGTYLVNDGHFFINKFIRLVGTAFNAAYICYQKYMMEKLYYPYWNIAFMDGIMMFFLSSVFLTVILLLKESKSDFISSFYLYFKVKEGLGLAILKAVIDFIIHLIMCPLTILTIFYFSPNFILIIFQLSAIARNIMDNSAHKLYCIIFYAIQLFALMIHLEIIELNFCDLNKNTKRNIDLRGMNDVIFEERDSTNDRNSIEIEKGYTIGNTANDQQIIELKEKDLESMN